MTYSPSLLASIKRPNREPVFVTEIIFNDGKHGIEGENDIYFGSADVSEIKNFPFPKRYIPTLDVKSLSAVTNKLNVITSRASIGNLQFRAEDVDGLVSGVIRAADGVLQGLKRQLMEMYEIERGGDWTTDRTKIRTMKIIEAKQSKDGLWWTFIASDVQSDMQKKVFSKKVTQLSAPMLAGDLTASVVDSFGFLLVPQPAPVGLSGVFKIGDEQVKWTAVSPGHVFTIPPGGRGINGTVAVDHDQGEEVTEVVSMRGNRFYISLAMLTSTGTGTNGPYDVYPEHWGVGLDWQKDVAVSEWESVGYAVAGFIAQDAGSGRVAEFVTNKSISAKMFIEKRILRNTACFSKVLSDGTYSVQAFSNVASIDKENADRHLTVDNIISMGDINLGLPAIVNNIELLYNEVPKLSGNYTGTAVFIELVSAKKYGVTDVPLTIKDDGLRIDDLDGLSQSYQQVYRYGDQQSNPGRPLEIVLRPSEADIVVGEIVRVTYPLEDVYAGGTLDVAAQVERVSLSPTTGEPTINAVVKTGIPGYWRGTAGVANSVVLSPATLHLVSGDSHQMVLRVFSQLGDQLHGFPIEWVASGNITVDSNGLLTALGDGVGSLYAITGGIVSNTSSITIAPISVNSVASVVVSPSSVSLNVPVTQQLSAQAFDFLGDETTFIALSWASDNPAIATVDSVTGLVTAVADGTCNITATIDTVDSSPVPVTVAAVQVAGFVPKPAADLVFQQDSLGNPYTQITDQGPPGGPHVIPDGYDFPDGDWWYDGSVSLPEDNTMTVNGNTRIFSVGSIVIFGHIDGDYRGLPGGTWNSRNGGEKGFVGRGGDGLNVVVPFIFGFPIAAGLGGAVLDPSGDVSIVGISTDGTGAWDKVSGIPEVLTGSGGGASGAPSYAPELGTGDGAPAGAGLLLMCRSISLVTGSASFRGADAVYTPGKGLGAGGGGGTLVCVAESNDSHISKIIVLKGRVITSGGLGASNPEVGVSAQNGGPGKVVLKAL